MLSVKTKRRLIAVLILSLAAAAALGWWGASVPFQQVIATLPAGETIYGIDRGEDQFRFFQTDESGALLAEIRRDVRDGSAYRSYDCLVRDGDAVYVLERKADIVSDLILSETVYYCNFAQGRLEAVWELPVEDNTQDNNLAIQVRDGVLYCFRTDYTGKTATARLYKAMAGSDLIEVVVFETDIGVGFTDFYASASGKVAFTTPAGEIYVFEPGEEPEAVFPRTEGEPLLLFADDGADGLYAAGPDGRVYRMDLSGTGRAVYTFDRAEREIPDRGISAVAFDTDGTCTAAVSDGSVLGIFRESGAVTPEKLNAPAGHIALRALLGFLTVWALAALVYLAARVFLLLTRGKVPIVTKLLCAFLPILIVSLVVVNALVNAIFRQELVDGQYERLYLLTSQQTATLNTTYIKEIDTTDAFDNVYFYEIRSALNVLPNQGELHRTSGGTQEVYNSNYFWLYKLEGEQLVSLICEQDYVGVPVEARYSAAVAEEFYQVAETGETIRTSFRDNLGTWTILLTPVLDKNGDVVAVIETGDTQQSLDYAVEQGARTLTLVNLSVLAVLAVLLSAVIAYSLHPLGILKRRVQEISDGNLGVQAPERGRDEVAEITRAFNAMSRSVAFRDKEIRMTSDGYSRFVPARVFDLLEKSSVIDVRLEDQTSVEATVLNCSVGAFDDIARSLRSREMFRLINQVLSRLVPVVDATGGLVDRFDRAGLLAIYTERPDRALDAAVQLCQTLRPAQLEEAEGQDLAFHVTLSAGPAMIGIVGAEERLEAMTISEHTSFTSFLRPLAVRYGASVLITGSAAALIPDFETRYHARTIGFVQMRTLDRLERLYDVYDGDDELTRQRKEETKAQFERGVALFCSKEYYDARLLFIEVLKKHRQDQAAKHYLYLCDTYYREENGGEHPVWLESY